VFVAVVTSSSGSLAIIRRDTCMSRENGELIGRLDLERMTGMEGWQPDRKLLDIIVELRREGRL